MNNWKMDFLLHVYFGTEGTDLKRFIFRAYLDMNRTLRGIAMLDPKGEILTGARALLGNYFITL